MGCRRLGTGASRRRWPRQVLRANRAEAWAFRVAQGEGVEPGRAAARRPEAATRVWAPYPGRSSSCRRRGRRRRGGYLGFAEERARRSHPDRLRGSDRERREVPLPKLRRAHEVGRDRDEDLLLVVLLRARREAACSGSGCSGGRGCPVKLSASRPWIRPPRSVVSPSRSRRMPVTFRVRNVGTLMGFCPVPTFRSSPIGLNSAAISRVMSPLALTLGVISRLTPTLRYWKDVAGANGRRAGLRGGEGA